MARTDIHRPGAIVPRDYMHLVSFSGGASGEPPINTAQVRKLCEAIGWYGSGRIHGQQSKCGVCGAWFRHGDLYKHEPTGDLVFMGHECAEKYEMVADRDDWCAELEALKRGRAARLEALRREERYAWFCKQHDGLAQVLEMDHAILADLKGKLRQWGSISEKQIAFAFKLASEVWKPKQEERHVPAPTGRTVVRGVVVSKKTVECFYGLAVKITVKVQTEQGSWLVWCTMPAALAGVEVGTEVEFTATLERGKDEHFAFGKRPSKARKIAA